jgi:putative aldouronate transport system substrate-binding protein
MLKGKKVLCVATALLMIVPMMFTGCKKAPAAAKTPVTLTIWLAGDAQKGITRVDDAINAYLKTKGSNISVNIQMMGWGDDFNTKASTMFTTGGADADIVFTCNWVDKYRQNANAGYLVDLTSDLKTTEGKAITKILGQDFLNGSKIKGKNYALPVNKEKAHDWGFLVRTDLYTKYNMASASIKTMADMEPFYAMAKADNVIPLDIAAFDSPWHLLDWDMVSDDGIPAAINDTTNKVVNPFTDATSVTLYNTLKGYADKGYISKDATTSQGIDADLKTGNYFCGVDSLKPGKDSEESQSTGVKYTQIDITPVVKSNRETTGAMLGINVNSKNKADSFDFLYMLYNDPILVNMINFGQVGTDYTQDATTKAITPIKSDYVYGQGWSFGNQFNDFLLSTEAPTKWADFAAFNAKAKVLPSLGFMYDDTAMQTQEAALGTVVNTYYKQLLAGQVDVTKTVAEMSTKLDAAGEAAFLADIQKQYDAFPKAK